LPKSTAEKNGGTTHVAAVQAARGIAALLVVVHHAAEKGWILSAGALISFPAGAIGVDVFFMISGFIIYHVTIDKGDRRRAFITKRAVRIFPMYWALSLVALAVFLVSPGLVNSNAVRSTDPVGSFLLYPTGRPFLLNNGWTLTYELLFYALWCLIAMPRPSSRTVAWCGVFLISASLLSGISLLPYEVFNFSLLLEFAVGMALAAMFKAGHLRTMPVLGSILLLCGLVSAVLFSSGIHSAYRGFIMAPPALLIFMGALLVGRFWTRLPSMSRIGDSSYSLYLFHPFMLAWMPFAVRHFGLVGAWQVGSVVAVFCILSTLASYVVYKVVELPLINGARRLL
jgi:peptidoglycan/LPS O-acetylase OafA/YrhL